MVIGMEYKRIRFGDLNRSQGGCRALYELSEEVAYDRGRTRYVIADFAYTFDHGPETMVFPCDKDGNVLSWGELWESYGDAVSDDSAVAAFCAARNLPGRFREVLGL